MEHEPIGFYITLLVICIVVSAMISSSEAAILSLRKARAYTMVRKGIIGAKTAAELVNDPEIYLPTILLINNLVNTAAATLATAIALSIISNQEHAILLATFAVTGILLIFGESIPKSIGVRYPDIVTIIFARPIWIFRRLFYPLTGSLSFLTQKVLGIFGAIDSNQISEDELRSMIMIGRDTGAITEMQSNLLDKIFKFSNQQIREIMTPRIELVFIERGLTLSNFFDVFAKFPHSIFPISSSSDENDIVALLNTKDVLREFSGKRISENSDVTTLSRPVVFVPETNYLVSLLDELQRSGQEMVVVVDEFGQISGIVTMTQLLEEIIGPINEDILDDDDFFVLDNTTCLVNGGARIADVNERFGIVIPDGDYETLAGFILEVLGRIPVVGDEYKLDDVQFSISRMRGMRIARIKVVVPVALLNQNYELDIL